MQQFFLNRFKGFSHFFLLVKMQNIMAQTCIFLIKYTLVKIGYIIRSMPNIKNGIFLSYKFHNEMLASLNKGYSVNDAFQVKKYKFITSHLCCICLPYHVIVAIFLIIKYYIQGDSNFLGTL